MRVSAATTQKSSPATHTHVPPLFSYASNDINEREREREREGERSSFGEKGKRASKLILSQV
jgi:hypothetical protein